MARLKNRHKEETNQGVSVEIVSLDTLVYRNQGHELSAYIERGKKEGGDEFYVDLSATDSWTTPEGVKLNAAERKNIAAAIVRALKIQGITALVETG